MSTIVQPIPAETPTVESPTAETPTFLTGFDVFRNEEQARIQSETKTVFNLMKQMPFIADKWKKTSDECKDIFKKRGSTIQKPPRKTTKLTRVADSGPQKRKRKKRDPTLPKRPCSAFIFFSCERRPSMVLESPHLKPTEILKCMGMEWKQLVDRAPYQAMSDRDKVRYMEAMAALVEVAP